MKVGVACEECLELHMADGQSPPYPEWCADYAEKQEAHDHVDEGRQRIRQNTCDTLRPQSAEDFEALIMRIKSQYDIYTPDEFVRKYNLKHTQCKNVRVLKKAKNEEASDESNDIVLLRKGRTLELIYDVGLRYREQAHGRVIQPHMSYEVFRTLAKRRCDEREFPLRAKQRLRNHTGEQVQALSARVDAGRLKAEEQAVVKSAMQSIGQPTVLTHSAVPDLGSLRSSQRAMPAVHRTTTARRAAAASTRTPGLSPSRQALLEGVLPRTEIATSAAPIAEENVGRHVVGTGVPRRSSSRTSRASASAEALGDISGQHSDMRPADAPDDYSGDETDADPLFQFVKMQLGKFPKTKHNGEFT